jgi:hypothetical protein
METKVRSTFRQLEQWMPEKRASYCGSLVFTFRIALTGSRLVSAHRKLRLIAAVGEAPLPVCYSVQYRQFRRGLRGWYTCPFYKSNTSVLTFNEHDISAAWNRIAFSKLLVTRVVMKLPELHRHQNFNDGLQRLTIYLLP